MDTGLKRDLKWIGLALLILLLFRLAILDNHGFNKDARVETTMAHDNIALVLKHYTQGDFENPSKHIRSNLGFYGTFFNLTAYVFQILWMGSETNNADAQTIKLIVLTFFYVSGSGALAIAVRGVTGSALWAVISILVLELMPVYFGYGTNNVKDIPFAVMFTISSCTLAYAITALNQTTVFNKSSLKPALLAGLSIGLAASVRMPGVILWLHAVLVYAFLHQRAHHRLFSSQLIGSLLLTGIAAFLTIWFLQPVSWPDPINWMSDTIAYMSHHPHYSAVLTNGEQLESKDAPLKYVLLWIFAPLPLLWFVCSLLGFWQANLCYRAASPLARALILLMLLQLTSIPAAAVLESSNLYDGIRHLLFIYPAIAFFSVLGLWALGFLQPPLLKKGVLAVAILAGLNLIIEMIRIHPYEHSYFNEATRHERMLDYWRVDVWAFADKETAEWLNKHAKPDSIVLYYLHASGQLEAFVRPDINVELFSPQYMLISHFYVVLFNKDNEYYQAEEIFDNCKVVHRVTRPLGLITLPIATIYDCTSDQIKVM